MELIKSLTLKEAKKITGGVSEPGKMPGLSFSIPATECKVGGFLRKVEGSTCSKCYAMKGRYVFGNVKNAMWRRLDSYNSHVENGTIEEWIDAMVFFATSKRSKGYFRWFDSGDLQSVEMLCHIIEVARRAPEVKFWLPTREYGIIRDYLNSGPYIPDNLTIRISAAMIGECPPNFNHPRIVYSVVHHKNSRACTATYSCPAYIQDGKCLDCRACWSQDVLFVSYPQH